MALSCMNFGRIRDLTANCGWKEKDMYILGSDCLNSLESIEELLHDDVVGRNVHISLHICGLVKKDLIPILHYANNDKIIAVATRILMNLSLPVETLSPNESTSHAAKTNKNQKLLYTASLEIKKSFLEDAATSPIVRMLREAMLISEKHNRKLSEDDCIHLKNCLFLLRNLLHIPEKCDSSDKTFNNFQEWQSVQNKLIWNLFVQGVDGALLLMLNSKYRFYWTTSLTLIIALLYRNQNISKVHEALELISSGSETSADEEESDGSKNSSTSLSSEPSKANGLSDSGCVLTSDVYENSKHFISEPQYQATNYNTTSDIHMELEKVQISHDSEPEKSKLKSSYEKQTPFSKPIMYEENYSGCSSCFESPRRKRIKCSMSPDDQGFMSEDVQSNSKGDSGDTFAHYTLSSTKDRSREEILEDKKFPKSFKAAQKLRMQSKVLSSDSSNEDMQNFRIKYRSHPPVGKRGKIPRRNSGCFPSICMDSALASSAFKGRMKYPLWEKRNSITALVDNNSPAPSDEDLGNLLKEFTMGFLHSGFSNLVKDIKNVLLDEPNVTVDKSLLFWILSYFLRLASTVYVNIEHLNDVLSPEIVSYLVYECVLACENLEMHVEADLGIKKYLTVQLSLVVNALKEIMVAIDKYSRKCNLQKDKAYFSELLGKLASLQHLKYLPLLLFHNLCQVDSKSSMEDAVIFNHYILLTFEKANEQTPESERFDLVNHLKNFSTPDVINSYGRLLEKPKYNSTLLNECIFTMIHHIAGDIQASDCLIQPTILKNFSNILKEDIKLEPYQEDLIMYVLNKFSLHVQKKHFKRRRNEKGEATATSDHSSTNRSSNNSNCLLRENDDDLFWWYLQFEQDKDPISRISEYISSPKRDILSKLLMKGIISTEIYQSLELKMEVVEKDQDLLTCGDLGQVDNFDDEITRLLRTIVQSGGRECLTWLQNALLETCYVKLGSSSSLPEPTPFYSVRMMPVLLVPYTADQRKILKDELFLLLLKKIGFEIGTHMCPTYPRIPAMWTANILFTIAARLGPVDKDTLKFSYEELLIEDPIHDTVVSNGLPNSRLPPLSSCHTLSSWLAAVQKSKEEQIIFSPK